MAAQHMLSAQRRHDHERINKRNKVRLNLGYSSMSWGWPGIGIGREWKRRLSKARRKFVKMRLRGYHGKEPIRLESEVNWKTW